jgi:signal recognition particle GTPase
LGRTPYRYNPEVLRQECVPGTTVSDVVEVIQHFNPKNMASLLDFVDLLQLREKAESSSREDSAND